jgi:hypothetical protein
MPDGSPTARKRSFRSSKFNTCRIHAGPASRRRQPPGGAPRGDWWTAGIPSDIMCGQWPLRRFSWFRERAPRAFRKSPCRVRRYALARTVALMPLRACHRDSHPLCLRAWGGMAECHRSGGARGTTTRSQRTVRERVELHLQGRNAGQLLGVDAGGGRPSRRLVVTGGPGHELVCCSGGDSGRRYHPRTCASS